MATPYRAIESDHGSWHVCQECEWAGDYGGEEHCEKTGHRVRADRWSHFEKHCDVEAQMSISEEQRESPPKGALLFWEDQYQDEWYEFAEAADDPTWEQLQAIATRMMIKTEDTHHCFLEAVHPVPFGEEMSRALAAAKRAGIADASERAVYRFGMGS